MRPFGVSAGLIAAALVLASVRSFAAIPVVSLPTDATITGTGTTTVSATIDVADGIMGIDIKVQYDSGVVSAIAAGPGTLTGGCTLASNLTTGQAALSIACVSPLSGAGSLFTLTFQGVAVGSTALTLAVCNLNDIPCTPNNGAITVLAPTATPTPTATATATATGTPTGGPAVNLTSGVGRPGGLACLPATLSYGAPAVAGTSNDIGFDAAQFTLNSCIINPAIGPGSLANKSISVTPLGSGSEEIDVSGSNTNVIPPGPLFTCIFRIALGVGAGVYAVSNAPSAVDTGGNSIPAVTGTAGQVRVTSCTGDCDGNGSVSIGEVVKCVNLFLGQPLCNASDAARSCPMADSNLDGSVSIGEVTQCVNRYLGGC